MASNILVNVYKINNNAITAKAMGFPAASLFRATPSDKITVGSVDCYGIIQHQNTQYYVVETVSELVTKANAAEA